MMSNFLEAMSVGSLIDGLTSILLFADAADGPASLKWWIDLTLHADKRLEDLVTAYGIWTHLILFAIIFCETGLVFTPFLPGDSLLLVAGAFAANGFLRIDWLIPLLLVAAILGDTVNYWMGKWIGVRAFSGRIPFLNKDQLDETHRYFDKYGAKTIIIARFVPFIRTFAPFVAGIGSMNYGKFIVYNIVGGVVWVLTFLLGGWAFGNIPLVKDNFKFVTIAIILLSLVPVVMHFIPRGRRKKTDAETEPVKVQV